MSSKTSVWKMSGSLLEAAAMRSNPPPKSTFCFGRSVNEPSGCLMYCMKTEFAISRNRPHSQLGWHSLPYFGSWAIKPE